MCNFRNERTLVTCETWTDNAVCKCYGKELWWTENKQSISLLFWSTCNSVLISLCHCYEGLPGGFWKKKSAPSQGPLCGGKNPTRSLQYSKRAQIIGACKWRQSFFNMKRVPTPPLKTDNNPNFQIRIFPKTRAVSRIVTWRSLLYILRTSF